PDWLQSSFDRFAAEAVGDDNVDCWVSMLTDWVELEREQGFATPRLGFSHAKRPEAVATWMKNGRRGRISVKGPHFVAEWNEWWADVNKGWRKPDDRGKLVVVEDGDSTVMMKPGRNGFLNVIGALCGLKDVADADIWAAELRDVRWV
ncbi:hypothetical protein K474DRAFT_1569007, partial [Panus rudis PR-1116 ss-1]